MHNELMYSMEDLTVYAEKSFERHFSLFCLGLTQEMKTALFKMYESGVQEGYTIAHAGTIEKFNELVEKAKKLK